MGLTAARRDDAMPGHLRYEDLDPDPWDDGYLPYEIPDDGSLVFVVAEPDPERLGEAVRAATKLLDPSPEVTEFNPDYTDEPGWHRGEAFFVNVSGSLQGLPVTISVGGDAIVLKFPTDEVYPLEEEPRSATASCSARSRRPRSTWPLTGRGGPNRSLKEELTEAAPPFRLPVAVRVGASACPVTSACGSDTLAGRKGVLVA